MKKKKREAYNNYAVKQRIGVGEREEWDGVCKVFASFRKRRRGCSERFVTGKKAKRKK